MGKFHAMNQKKKEEYVYKPMTPQQRKKRLIIGGIAVVICLALLALNELDLLHGARLRYYEGKLYGVDENDVIADRGKNSSEHKYYRIAEFNLPVEGMTYDPDYKVSTDENKSSWCLYIDSGEGCMKSVFVIGRAAAADEAISNVRLSVTDDDGNEIMGTDFEGENANGMKYIGYVAPAALGNFYDDGLYHKYAYAFVEADSKNSVVIQVNAEDKDPSKLASDEAMIEVVKAVADHVSEK